MHNLKSHLHLHISPAIDVGERQASYIAVSKSAQTVNLIIMKKMSVSVADGSLELTPLTECCQQRSDEVKRYMYA